MSKSHNASVRLFQHVDLPDIDDSQNYHNGRFRTFEVQISNGHFSSGSCFDQFGTKGDILSVSDRGWAPLSPDALIIDATRWMKSSSDQGYLITTDRTPTTINSNPIRVRVDRDGDL